MSLLKNPAFFDHISANAARIATRDWPTSDRVIRRSASLHLKHITGGGDPFETDESRPLDFGHWAAHRIEAMTKFTVRHGEAVAIGLAIDCAYSRLVHGFPVSRERQLRRCLSDLALDVRHAALQDPDALVVGLEEFRQHLGGRLTITMLQDAGRPVDVHDVDAAAMRHAIRAVADNLP